MGVFLRLFCLIAGLVMAFLTIDDVRVVGILAGLADTDAAAATLGLGYALAALLFGGAALSLPAPRAASIAFLLAGAIGLFVGSSTAWGNAVVWGGGALLLALLAYIGHRIKKGKDRRKVERQIEEKVAARVSAATASQE